VDLGGRGGTADLPGLVPYDEVVERKEIRHALRFTCPSTRRAYVPPARHWASSSTNPALPPMGMRVRLKAGFDVSPYPANVRVILNAMKKHGMLIALERRRAGHAAQRPRARLRGHPHGRPCHAVAARVSMCRSMTGASDPFSESW
jgi:hypothetical protein